MGKPTTEELEAAVWSHPDELRRPVLESVSRQFHRIYPDYARNNPEKSERMILRLTNGILLGKGGGGEDDQVDQFLGKIESGRAANWPRDENGTTLPSSQLTDEQKRLFAGYRGPGWDQSEWEQMSDWDQGRKLSPGEYWDWQHGRDLDLLRTTHTIKESAKAGTAAAKGSTMASAWAGNTDTPEQMSQKLIDQRQAEALDWWKRSAGKQYHSEGAFEANYPQSSITKFDGKYPEGLVDATRNQDHLLGGVFGAMNVTVPAFQGGFQGEGFFPSLSRSLQANRLAHKVDRNSPILPDGSADPSERISLLEGMRGVRDDLAPVNPADSQYLQTGVPHTQAANIVKRGLYELGDLSVAATTPLKMVGALGRSKSMMQGLGGMLGAAKTELGGELLWGLPFEGADAAVAANEGSLFEPDYGHHGLDENKNPVGAAARAVIYERIRRAQEQAAKDASVLLAPGKPRR